PREDEGSVPFDVDLFEPVQPVEQRLCLRRLERACREPLAEVARPRRAVGPQVAAADLCECAVRIDVVPAVDPLVRPDEGHLDSAWRPLAELSEEEGEARPEPLLVPSAYASQDFVGKLLPEQAPTVECLPDRTANRLHLVPADLRMEDAGRVSPGGQLGRRSGGGPASCVPESKLVGRMQMKRSAKRPGFDE